MADLNINYKMEVYQIESEEGKEWVAEYPTLKGVIGTGENQLEAVNDLIESANIHINVMKSMGIDIPKDDLVKESKDFSGNVAYRTSKRIHKELYEYAESQGESMSNVITEALIKYMNFENTTKILDKYISNIKETSDSFLSVANTLAYSKSIKIELDRKPKHSQEKSKGEFRYDTLPTHLLGAY